MSALAMSLAALPAAAQEQTPTPTPASDTIDLVGLTTRQPTPDSPPSDIQFHVTLNYRLQSVDSGFVLLFLFENSDQDSSQESSDAIPVHRGNGQLVMDIDYRLKPDVHTLTLVGGLFKGEQKLLSWVSTNPLDMAPWPGRVAFEKAMAARLNNELTGAQDLLSAAIQESPQTGNYFYWRGDTRVRLQDYQDAESDFSQAITLMPKDRASRVGRGIARLWLGKEDAAVEDLSWVIDSTTKPDTIAAWAYRARGLAHAAEGDAPAAVADYQQYLALAPNASDRPQVEGWIADLS
jgi:tetratricopeptide (TPR) repeat protein